ncbi:MAG: DUF5715 family protein [Gemmatimonadota bacterium]|nr:DUF5715 family protein [Gemmatimonadota bacterium]
MTRGGAKRLRRNWAWAPWALGLFIAPSLEAQSLRGSQSSMERQNRQAQVHDYTFLRNSSHVSRFVDLGLLVPLSGNANYELNRVSFPYARPEVRLFVQRLSRQYRLACGEKLVVTSLTRPTSRQPRNSSDLSVHPTGMAVDLRRSNSRACRSWLEDVLLSLERSGVLEATRERRPPHYHVALFPGPYGRYVARRVAEERVAVEQRDGGGGTVRYEVRRGDSLWTIAQAHGITVDRLRSANALRGSRIYEGQVLDVPVGR